MASAFSASSLSPDSEHKLHHVGFIVASIEECAEQFAQSLCLSWDGVITFDPIQNVRVSFFAGHKPTDALIELVEPGAPDSPVSKFLKRGGGLHHVCYEVNNLESHLEWCKTVGTIIVHPPVPATAFGGRRIAWGLTKKKMLVEFLETAKPTGT